MKIELAKCKICGGSGVVHVIARRPYDYYDQDERKIVSIFAECTRCGERTCGSTCIEDAVEEWNEFNKEEEVTFENGKIYQVKSPETGNIYPAFWSSDRERFVVLQLVAGGEVNTFELEKGCVVEVEE